ncbi:Retrovirus-related Pol polyprotein like [Argiope bruennichi]|uniref:Retrovirus-related Pol polyprotein like n=1 Tax=Argiope bruennichi TaxID=94029 RepID=A0A8T0FPK5_ARGBR|nr:Retrovirus-related Pol polyprotein like [Argiope bruennichi]
MGQKSGNGLFLMEMLAKNPRNPINVLISSGSNTLQVMHKRMFTRIKNTVLSFLKSHGISLSNENSEFYVVCAYGKSHRKSFHSRTIRPTKPEEQINADVIGSMEEDSVSGSRFMLVLEDDYTKFCRIFFLNAKSEVPNCIETFLNEAKTAVYTIKQILCDPAMIQTPEQKGAAERENRTIVEAARAMVHQKELPKKLWAEASYSLERRCNVIFCDELTYKPLTVEISDSNPEEEIGSTEVSVEEECLEEPVPVRRYPERKHNMPEFLSENYVLFVSPLTGIETSACYSEAMRSPEFKLWERAMIEELQSHDENGTLKLEVIVRTNC